MIREDGGEQVNEWVGDQGEKDTHDEEADDECGDIELDEFVAEGDVDDSEFGHRDSNRSQPAAKTMLSDTDKGLGERVGDETRRESEGDVYLGSDGNGCCGERLKRHWHHGEKEPD